ncbi:MAG: hypothetical protein ABEJ59_05525 [Halanaeroarchaeum sp.]
MMRRDDVDRFYGLLDDLAKAVDGPLRLGDCTGHMDWPDRGVYVFFAPDEYRASGEQRRVTRIGTHAVSEGGGTSLWNRLRAHRGAMRGTYEGGGNHRGSVVRERIGEAMIEREGLHDEYPHRGEGSSAKRDRRLEELEMERRVSGYIRELPFLWLRVDDEPSGESQRAYIERNVIALRSNDDRTPVDPRSADWLGADSTSEEMRKSGLWNVDHVGEEYDPAFFATLSEHVESTESV